jgi:hypothetical protein
MEQYDFSTLTDHHWPEDIKTNLNTLVEKAVAGTLTNAEFYELAELEPTVFGTSMTKRFLEYEPTPTGVPRSMFLRMMTSKFRFHLSFAVFTVDFQDSLARLMQGLKVHEPCARRGLLQPWMASRGLDWACSDLTPRADHVEALDALEAVEKYKPDAVFVSWFDYCMDLDQQLAAKVPCVFIVEGCTGTTESGFYDNDAYEVFDTPEWFVDVPRWSCMKDRTIITVPRGGSNPFNVA